MTFGPDGLLYVALANTGNDIWLFDGKTGASLGPFIQASDPHPDGPFNVLFAPDGTVYVSARDTDNVLRYASTGDYIDDFASGGGLDNATGLVFLPEPGTETLLGAGLALLIALARRRYRGSRSERRV